jgi:hypothetical protein
MTGCVQQITGYEQQKNDCLQLRTGCVHQCSSFLQQNSVCVQQILVLYIGRVFVYSRILKYREIVYIRGIVVCSRGLQLLYTADKWLCKGG